MRKSLMQKAQQEQADLLSGSSSAVEKGMGSIIPIPSMRPAQGAGAGAAAGAGNAPVPPREVYRLFSFGSPSSPPSSSSSSSSQEIPATTPKIESGPGGKDSQKK
jgi:hypothetical protein